jgi:hypothetical protein
VVTEAIAFLNRDMGEEATLVRAFGPGASKAVN